MRNQPRFPFHGQKIIYRLKDEKYDHEHYQLVPPSNHRANNVERDIQGFKNHVIAGLCSVDTDYYLQLWDILLHQATISLILLSRSITLTHISAYNHIFKEFYFNCIPLAPPSTRVVIHNIPNDCA